jgi:hypothetical protein
MRNHKIQFFTLPLDQPTGNERRSHPKPTGLAVHHASEYSPSNCPILVTCLVSQNPHLQPQRNL